MNNLKLRKAMLIAIAGTALATASTHASADIFLSGTGYIAGAQSWNGNNNGYLGWGHTSDWFTFQATSTGNVDVKMTASIIGEQPAFSLWSTGTGEHTWSDGHEYSQIINQIIDGSPATFVGFSNNYGSDAYFGHGSQDLAHGGAAALAGTTSLFGTDGAGHNYAELIFSNAIAGTWYTIAAGGSGGLVGGYSISAASVSAVPLPAAVWLFGSALMGYLGLQKRKMAA